MRLVDIDDIRVMKFLSEEDDPSESDGEREYRNGWNDAIDAINDIQPFAEPKKGKWIEREEDMDGMTLQIKRCSECGASKPMKIFSLENFEFNFCPNCGTQMSEGEEEGREG